MRSPALSLLLVCACRSAGVGDASGELRVPAAALDFGPVFVGADRTLELEVGNTGRSAIFVEPTLEPPFSAASRLVVPGGTTVSVSVVFRPSREGEVAGTLRLGGLEVPLRGVGLAALECPLAGACDSVAFDAHAGACVRRPVPDGLDCAPAYACFARAECRGGECVGALDRCDDADACTLDACGPLGCAHVDVTFDCPAPSDPCLVPGCDPRSGCTSVEAPDGTACGPRSCDTAQVCIAGRCVLRPVPQTQACVEVVAGVPASATSVDGLGTDARFYAAAGRIAADGAGNVWVLEAFQHTLRRVAASGRVTTVAGLARVSGTQDGFGWAARFDSPRDLAADGRGNVYVGEATRIRKVSPLGWVSTLAGVPPVSGTTPAQVDGIGSSARFVNIVHLAAANDGTLYAVEASVPPVLRAVSPLGEVRTLRFDPLAPPVFYGDVAAVDGGVVLLRGSHVDGMVPWLVQPDAGAHALGGAGAEYRIASTGGMLVAGTRGIDVHSCDAVEQMFWAPGSAGPDGQCQAEGQRAVRVQDVAASQAGLYVLGTSALGANPGHVFELVGGAARLLAGPPVVEPSRDGPALDARFDLLDRICVTDDGILVSDAQLFFCGAAPTLRRIRAGTVTTEWGASGFIDDLTCTGGRVTLIGHTGIHRSEGDGGWRERAAFAPTLFPSMGVPFWTRIDEVDGEVRFTLPRAINALLPDGGAEVLAGVLGPHVSPVPSSDGGVAFVGPTDLALTRDGGMWILDGNEVQFASATGVVTLAGDNREPPGDVDGPGSVARFDGLWSIALEPSGDAVVTDSANLSVRRVTRSGVVTTLARIADAPNAISVEDGGALLVTVPGAVIRIRL